MLEREYLHSYVAIEPQSGDFFVGKTMSEAIDAAESAHPDRVTHTIRIGHDGMIAGIVDEFGRALVPLLLCKLVR